MGLQLTFPAVYSDLYAAAGEPLEFEPEMKLFPAPLPIGVDLQAGYHNQKMLDAHRRALNGVRDTAAAKMRYVMSPAGYYNLPPVLLTQRRFANASNGAAGFGGDLYSGRHEDGLRGGVLRTMRGQEYGRHLLAERAKQLDAIDAAAQQTGMTGELPAESQLGDAEVGEAPVEATKAKLELVALLEAVRTAFINDNVSQLTLADFFKALRIIFRIAATEDRESLEDLLDYFNSLALLAQKDEGRRMGAMPGEEEDAYQPFNRYIYSTKEYLEQMFRAVDRPVKERKALSRTLVKNLGFSRLSKQSMEETEAIERQVNELFEKNDPEELMRDARAFKRAKKVREAIERLEVEEEAKADRERMRRAGAIARGLPIPADARLRPNAFGVPERVAQPLPVVPPRFDVGEEGELPGFREFRPIYAPPPRNRAGRLDVAPQFAAPEAPPAVRAYLRRARPDLDLPAVRAPAARGPTVADYMVMAGRQRQPRFDPAPREAFGARQGRFIDEVEEAAPAPRANVGRMGMRPAEMPVAAPRQAAPIFERAAEPGAAARAPADVRIREGMRQMGEEIRGMREIADRMARPAGRGRGRPKKAAAPAGDPLKARLATASLTRATLPKTREGFVELAEKLRGSGHKIRVNSGSQLKSIRANFIRKLGL